MQEWPERYSSPKNYRKAMQRFGTGGRIKWVLFWILCGGGWLVVGLPLGVYIFWKSTLHQHGQVIDQVHSIGQRSIDFWQSIMWSFFHLKF